MTSKLVREHVLVVAKKLQNKDRIFLEENDGYISDKNQVFCLMGLGLRVIREKNKIYLVKSTEISEGRFFKRLDYIFRYLEWVEGFQLDLESFYQRADFLNDVEYSVGIVNLDGEYFFPPTKTVFHSRLDPFETCLKCLLSF